MNSEEHIDFWLWVLLIVLGVGLMVDLGIEKYKNRNKS